MKKDTSPNPRTGSLDRIIGNHIRKKRRSLNIKLYQMGEVLDLSPQQIRKYEKGEDRVSAVNLWKLSKYLLTPITWFFNEEEEK